MKINMRYLACVYGQERARHTGRIHKYRNTKHVNAAAKLLRGHDKDEQEDPEDD